MLNIESLQSAVVRHDPFPHLTVKEIFEPAKYAELLRAVPDASQMLLYDPVNTSSSLTTDEFRKFAPDMADQIDAAMTRIGDIVVAKFTEDIFAAWSDLFPSLKPSDLWPRYQTTVIIDRGSGFKLYPHLDGAECLVTMLFYLAEDDKHAEHGTQLFSARKKWGCNKHYVSLTREARKMDLKLSSTVPYLPNSMMAFVDSPISFHGNAQMSMPTRKAIQSHIRLHPDAFHRLYKPLGPKLRDLPDISQFEKALGEIWREDG